MLDAAEHGRSEFGRVVVARDFGEALEARLAELPRLRRYRPMRFVGLADERDGVRSIRVLRQARRPRRRMRLRTRLLVAADGTRSGVREALGIGSEEHDYQQTLFVARLRAERAPDGTAYERFGARWPDRAAAAGRSPLRPGARRRARRGRCGGRAR